MKTVLALLMVLAIAGCGSDEPEYRQYVGAAAVTQGSGGTVERVEGVDFWQDGTPPRRYRILGQVDEEWRSPEMDRVDMKHLAPVVKEAGGDAAVLVTATDSGETSYNVAVIKYK
jgi:ABC-type glycerol-3-phosphate transport system substrate-binding protein